MGGRAILAHAVPCGPVGVVGRRTGAAARVHLSRPGAVGQTEVHPQVHPQKPHIPVGLSPQTGVGCTWCTWQPTFLRLVFLGGAGGHPQCG